MCWYKINNDFFLDEEDIGEVVCVKIYKYKYNIIKWYRYCLILSINYIDNKSRPNNVLMLKDDGMLLTLSFDYSNEIEIKYDTGSRSFLIKKC